MGDLNNIQKQLEAFMAMYKEDKAMMALRFEELSLQVTQSQKVPKKTSSVKQAGGTRANHHTERGIAMATGTTSSQCPVSHGWTSHFLTAKWTH